MLKIKGHGARTAWLAGRLSVELGASTSRRESIECAALTHDVGKRLIDRHLLDKPAQLTGDERRAVERHCLLGAMTLLAHSASDGSRDESVSVALLHHEWWDGRGYPFGVSGDLIPLSARIVAVADVFDALTSVRPYKGGWSPDVALTYISHRSGTQFDPRCVHALLNVSQREGASWPLCAPMLDEGGDAALDGIDLPDLAVLGDLAGVEQSLRRYVLGRTTYFAD